jgi:FAD:protein FMN transferase
MKVAHQVILHCAFILLTFSCSDKPAKVSIEGRAQGTTYRITYYYADTTSFRASIDSIFQRIDHSLSTYNAASLISRINRNDSSVLVDEYLTNVYMRSVEVARLTEGSFDFTVGPLVNAYGFGFTKKADITKSIVDSLLKLVDYKTVKLIDNRIVKQRPEAIIDFNAIAQGFTVDVICEFLNRNDVENYLVELGGELRAKGSKADGEPWIAGIEKPIDVMGTPDMQVLLKLENRAMATSGNYRRYYEEDGRRYAHILDPRTGYPADHNLLSATVFAPDCATADAYATAFMVMGLEASKRFVSKHPELPLDVFFIYDDNGEWRTYASSSLEKFFINSTQ